MTTRIERGSTLQGQRPAQSGLGPGSRRRSAIADLRSVVVVTQASFSLALATGLALAPPVLLLLSGASIETVETKAAA